MPILPEHQRFSDRTRFHASCKKPRQAFGAERKASCWTSHVIAANHVVAKPDIGARLLPKQDWRHGIRPLVHRIRQQPRAAGHAIVVVTQPRNGRQQHDDGRDDHAPQTKQESMLSQSGQTDDGQDAETEHESLVRPRQHQRAPPGAERYPPGNRNATFQRRRPLPPPQASHAPPRRAQNQAPTGHRQPAPAIVDSEVQRQWQDANDQPARQRPRRGQKTPQHPPSRDAPQRDANPRPDDRIPQDLSQREQHPLARRVLGLIRRLLDDVKGLEVLPQRVRRIRQPAVRERVGRQQVAELVMNHRQRHPLPAQEGARDQRQGSHQHGRQPS